MKSANADKIPDFTKEMIPKNLKTTITAKIKSSSEYEP